MNARHRQFALEYLVDLNASQAYRRVYPRAAAGSAGRNGHKLLGRPDVAAAIAEAMRERTDRAKIDGDWIVERLRQEAEGRGDGCTHSGRVRALELLGRHLGMFQDRVKLEGAIGLGVTLEVVEEIVDAPPAAAA